MLFLVLSRARNEFTAAIGGVLLTIAVHVWLLQFVAGYPLIGVVLNPVIGMAAVVAPQGPYGPHGPHVALNLWWLLWLVPLQVVVWIVLPMAWVLFRERRGGHL